MKKTAQTVITAGTYYTMTNANGMVMEAALGEENGAAVQLGTPARSEAQHWAFERVGEGVYCIKNRATGKLLDLVSGGSSDGTWLHQWEEANCSSQMWIVEPTNDGHVKLKTQLSQEKCVDVVDMRTDAGARLQIWQDVNGENQTWAIAKVTTRKAAAPKTAEQKAAIAAKRAATIAAKKAAAPAAKKATRKAAPKAKASTKKAPAKKL